MPIVDGYWVPDLSPKQFEVFNCDKRYLFICGPRRSGKTISAINRLIRHAFDTPNGHVAMFAKTTKVAKDGGVWTDLVDYELPKWVKADIGLKIITPPKVDGQTRQLYLEISNRYGGKCRIALNSLDYDGDIEGIIKGKRHSMVYISELSNHRKRIVFDTCIEALRMPGLPFEAHQFMADTNPSDEGEDSWIYKLAYEDRIAELDSIEDPVRRASLEIMQPHLGLIEVMIDDNPFLSPIEKATLKAQYAHDPDLYARYIEGLWKRATTDSLFSDVFRPGIHVEGDCSAPNERDWTGYLPQDDCAELLTGWDIGEVYHSIVFMEPLYMDNVMGFKVLDELVYLKQQISLADVADQVMEKMDFWESQCINKIEWRHWADKSAFDQFRPAAELYDYQVIDMASDGRIDLRAAPKFAGSVKQKIRMTRKLLHEDRLLISARCQGVIQMLKNLRSGLLDMASVDKTSIHRHTFDALAYVLMAELPKELFDPILNPKSGKAVGRIVAVG